MKVAIVFEVEGDKNQLDEETKKAFIEASIEQIKESIADPNATIVPVEDEVVKVDFAFYIR